VTHELYMDQPPNNDWSQISHEQQQQQIHLQHQHQQQLQLHQHHQQHAQMQMPRRNTFPIVRHDRDGSQQYFNNSHFNGSDHGSILGPYMSRHGTIYGEPTSDRSTHLPLPSEHSALMHNGRMDESYLHSQHGPYREYDHLEDGVKLEDPSPVIVPSQTAFYRPPSGGGMHPMSMSYLSPHTGLPVQHTDDAASKETQYLRRRCFNCHTTEPPSWRRSTLNPGKIVCNKCGLYERTHLRPRPLRFDELRAGNKARKQTKTGLVGSLSPKGGMVKKEPTEFGIVRRNSVSSTASSVHSGGATSDWDDSVSAYSSGSAPPSSYNSPAASTYPIPRDPNSQSPPIPSGGGIRLPNNPLTDIASLQQQQQVPTCSQPPTPRKAASAPSPYYNAYPTPPGTANGPTSHHMHEFRRGSLPLDLMGGQQRRSEIPDQVAAAAGATGAGWQNGQQQQIAEMPSGTTEVARQTVVAT
jgi:GATA-binding protein